LPLQTAAKLPRAVGAPTVVIGDHVFVTGSKRDPSFNTSESAFPRPPQTMKASLHQTAAAAVRGDGSLPVLIAIQVSDDESYIAHVQPGKTGELVWKFNRTGRFDFACLVPGHYEAGMVGTINVAPR
jgi:uncharacterized cupredoxin-like copper-binding protein